MNQESPSRSNGGKLESWAFGIIAALVFLLPLAFIPSAYFNQAAIKGYLVIFAVIASAILYLVSRWKTGSFEWINHPLSYVRIVFGLLLLVSALASGVFMKSFFGYGYEYTTAAFLILLGISAYLVALLSSRDPVRPLALYAALSGAFVLAALFQIVQLIRPGLLSFGVFTGSTSTPVGSWYDLGIMAATVFIIGSLSAIYAPFSRSWKIAIGAVSALAAFFVILIGLPAIWYGIALVFLTLAIHQYLNERKGKAFGKRLPIFALAVFVIAALFAWKGDIVTTPLVTVLAAGYSELHLPWQMTLDVGAGTMKASPLVGSGPNTFGQDYLLYKPTLIDQTQYWAVEFKSGFGFVPTLAVSLGLLGLVLICLVYIYFVRAGVKALRASRPHDPMLAYVSYSSFFAAAFLAAMALAYEVSYVNILLAFIFLGIFIGSRVKAGDAGVLLIPFASGKESMVYARGFAGLLILILLAGFVWYGAKATAYAYFERGVIAASASTTPDFAVARADFLKAAALDRSDTYYQALSQVDLGSASALASQLSKAQSAGSAPDQATVKALSDLLAEAASYATTAVAIDPTNYYNYLAQSQVYGGAASLQVTGAYAAAVTAYQNAIKDDPTNPALYLDLAQLAAGQSKYDDATGYIGSALQLKNNYTDAVYLLSQIQVAQGKTADAVTSDQFAVQLDPTDPTAYFQLGLLQYNAAEYSDAATSLAKAVSLNPQYANAQYFLGLSYSKIGDTKDAIAQFQALAKTNPDNTDVASILANLEAGKAPFANEAPPVSTPEKRSAPPINDQSSGQSTDASGSPAGTP